MHELCRTITIYSTYTWTQPRRPKSPRDRRTHVLDRACQPPCFLLRAGVKQRRGAPVDCFRGHKGFAVTVASVACTLLLLLLLLLTVRKRLRREHHALIPHDRLVSDPILTGLLRNNRRSKKDVGTTGHSGGLWVYILPPCRSNEGVCANGEGEERMLRCYNEWPSCHL